MATTSRKPRPGLVLTIFLVCVAALFGIMAIGRIWTPKLGLDLQGGMTITLTATNSTVEADNLELARQIIQNRVDSLGVSEAAVTTSGDRHIVVSAPNVQRDDLVDLIGSTAQLSFRPVLSYQPVAPVEENGVDRLPTPTPEPGAVGTQLPVDQVVAYQASAEEQSAFHSYQCGDEVVEPLDKATYACDSTKTMKFLLGPVAIIGERVTNAASTVHAGQVQNVVVLSFDAEGTEQLRAMTTALVNKPDPTNQFAVVLDGVVESNAAVRSAINDGNAEISGNFTPESAAQLANILRFGSLPLNFEPSQVETVSATLGGEQLRVGLIAGLIGLGLVIGYCLLYYRGLGLVVIGSLAVAALATYASMVILGEAMGFTLNLPAIAGAIVAIGVTADSFVIYFERIRDEIRDGRSLKSALTTGWTKARSTIVVADMVSILSALVLFILAVGGVKGFAFALGLTTLIDLAVCFFFTKPLVQVLGRTKFFGQGHKLSGLDASHMGVTRDSLLGRRRRSTQIVKEA
ncbi:protein translocase subunit SecD [Arachnia propionica]|uniref:Protein translocase subunit SecD n=2 Tax=Arachnia propionica TaxID=1750 RepID=A0A3P1WTD2_9ACTN|nr:protein translocase subunit SecD [Arachnia propionica]RRD49824.1 protein translocase subunit SecD [Arachnia propionica]